MTTGSSTEGIGFRLTRILASPESPPRKAFLPLLAGSTRRAASVLTMNNNPTQPSRGGSSETPFSSYSPWLRKPLEIVYQQEALESQQQKTTHRLRRHLTVWDLIGVGVGSSVGSGIFVLTGQIASQNAGPLTFVSFAVSGLAACLSGVCYAELSGRIPAAGSTYVYAYVCLGEVAAVVAASCLTLEYAISGAAVARSWGDKIVIWISGFFDVSWMEMGPVNLPAGFISILSTLLLLAGVQESKSVTNFFTALKMLIVVFMILGAFLLFEPKNMTPLAPFGMRGVFRGATSSFFGYLGYDEVCCVAGEAIDPARDIPRAVLGTLFIVTVCYIVAALALTGMLPSKDINPTSGFPDAFLTLGYTWAGQLTAIGELICLPVVVMLCLMVQPRLTLSMAHDGLLPTTFSKLDTKGNLFGGILICGIGMTLIATFVPFNYLDDLISAGILVAFSMTNACLVLMRCESPASHPGDLERCLAVYNAACLVTAVLWSHDFWFLPLQSTIAFLSTFVTLSMVAYMALWYPKSAHFGGSISLPPTISAATTNSRVLASFQSFDSSRHFQTPLVPYLPCFGMAVNWYLYVRPTGGFEGCVRSSYSLTTTLFVLDFQVWHSWMR